MTAVSRSIPGIDVRWDVSLQLQRWSAQRCIGGIDGLSNGTITINSIAQTPEFRYRGCDPLTGVGGIDWDEWTYGDPLQLQDGSGYSDHQPSICTNNANDESFLFGDTDPPYFINNGVSADWDFDEDDIYFEGLAKTNGDLSAEQTLASCNWGATGWRLYTDTKLKMDLGDGVNSATVASAALLTDTWYFFAGVMDSSGYGQLALQGSSSGAAVDISSVGSLSSAGYYLIGANNYTASYRWKGHLAYIAFWHRAAWVDTHAQDDLFEERFEAICSDCF